jgi:hypothetical protein
MLQLCNVPLNGIAGNGTWEEYSREFQKILSGLPVAVNGNGFSKEATVYGKATWENGSKASSACVNWLKSMVREQRVTSDTGKPRNDCVAWRHRFVNRAAVTACSIRQGKRAFVIRAC